MKPPPLTALLARARELPQTDADREAARRSFAYGNLALTNPATTREDIDRAAEAIERERGEARR